MYFDRKNKSGPGFVVQPVKSVGAPKVLHHPPVTGLIQSDDAGHAVGIAANQQRIPGLNFGD
jgi:hypothetical protein